jgi:hypothetical protein
MVTAIDWAIVMSYSAVVVSRDGARRSKRSEITKLKCRRAPKTATYFLMMIIFTGILSGCFPNRPVPSPSVSTTTSSSPSPIASSGASPSPSSTANSPYQPASLPSELSTAETIASCGSCWSGYEDNVPGVFGVQGTWTLPQLDCSGGDDTSAQWVGIGDTPGTELLQIGSSADCIGGASYSIWWENVDSGPATFFATRAPLVAGDTISAEIQVWSNPVPPPAGATSPGPEQVTLTLNVQSGGAATAYSSPPQSVAYFSPGSNQPWNESAEWIVEDPLQVNTDYDQYWRDPLSNFGEVTFTSALDRGSSPAGWEPFDFDPTVPTSVAMLSATGRAMATPSAFQYHSRPCLRFGTILRPCIPIIVAVPSFSVTWNSDGSD